MKYKVNDEVMFCYEAIVGGDLGSDILMRGTVCKIKSHLSTFPYCVSFINSMGKEDSEWLTKNDIARLFNEPDINSMAAI